MPGVKSVTALALVNTGRRYEEPRVAGIAHFLEHMVFKGTDSYPTAQELARTIDQVGGEFNAFTGKEYTGYYVKLASRDLSVALDVVTDMLCVPKLRQEDIDRESGVIVEEINMYEDLPMRQVGDVFETMMFAGSNLADPILGTKETVTSLKTDDFQSYLQTWYGFKNVVFVVAGDEQRVSDPKLVEEIDRLTQKGTAHTRQAKQQQPYFDKTFGTARKQIVFKKTEQAHFIMGMPSFGRHDDRRYILSVLNTLMGSTMSSRLFSEIREKRGLCYYVRSGSDQYHDGGAWMGSAGVDPRRIDEAIDAMRSEFLALVDTKPATAEEVAMAKQNIIGQLWLDLEDSQSVASWYGMKELLLEKIMTEQEVIAKIEAVTLDQVQQLATELVKPDQLRLALIGPYKETDINW